MPDIAKFYTCYRPMPWQSWQRETSAGVFQANVRAYHCPSFDIRTATISAAWPILHSQTLCGQTIDVAIWTC